LAGWHPDDWYRPVLPRGAWIHSKRRTGSNMVVMTKQRLARLLAESENGRELLSVDLTQEEEPSTQLRVVGAPAPAVAATPATPAPRGTIPIRTPNLTLHRVRNTPIYLAFNGMRLRLSEWASRLGVKYSTLYGRYRRGWSDVMILTTKDGRESSVRRLLFYRNAV
jgi:hypothetical protein